MNAWAAPAPVPNLTIGNFPQVLRARVVSLLKEINTLAGPYVDSTRAIPVNKNDQPRILVYLPTRNYELIGDAAPQFRATGHVKILGLISGAPIGAVETATETLGEQILSLMEYKAFLAPPVERVTAIDLNFEIEGTGDRFEGQATVEFAVEWTEIFEPVLAPFSGTSPPGAYGAPLEEIVLTVESAAGATLTGATIAVATTIS